MQMELRDIYEKLQEMNRIATQTGNRELSDALWEATRAVRKAKNQVDAMVVAAELVMSVSEGNK